MRARSQQPKTIMPEDLGLPAPRDSCSGIRMPDTSSQGLFLEGTAREKAQMLVGILHERSLLS